MTNPIFANEIHKATIEVYINMCKQFTKEVSSETKYKNYLDVVYFEQRVCDDILRVFGDCLSPFLYHPKGLAVACT